MSYVQRYGVFKTLILMYLPHIFASSYLLPLILISIDSLENLLDIEKKNQELQNLLDTATEQSRDYQSQLQQLNEQLDRMNNLENNPDTESENLKVLKEQIIHLEMNLQNKVQLVAEKEERISHLEDQQLEFQNVYNNEKGDDFPQFRPFFNCFFVLFSWSRFCSCIDVVRLSWLLKFFSLNINL